GLICDDTGRAATSNSNTATSDLIRCLLGSGARSRESVRSARRLEEPRDLAGHRLAPGLAIREHRPAVHRDRQLTEAAPADPRRNVQRALDLVTKAYRLAAQIHSDQAALDLDLHCPAF